MYDKTQELEKYLLKNYNVISIDNTKEIEPSPYDQKYENIYLLSFFGYRPSNELIDAILESPKLSNKIRTALMSMPDAEEKFELFKECFPKGDNEFGKKFVKDLKTFNEKGAFPPMGIEALTNPMKYSYIARTRASEVLNPLTPKYYETALRDILNKEDWSTDDCFIAVSLNDKCPISAISQNAEEETHFNKAMQQIQHKVIVKETKEEKERLINELQNELSNYSKTLNSLDIYSLGSPQAIDEYFSDIDSAFNSVQDAKDNLNNFIENKYNIITGAKESGSVIYEKTIDSMSAKNPDFILPTHPSFKEKVLDNIKETFYDKVDEMFNSCSKAIDTLLNPQTIVHKNIVLDCLQDIEYFHEDLQQVQTDFVDFVNKYYPVIENKEDSEKTFKKMVDSASKKYPSHILSFTSSQKKDFLKTINDGFEKKLKDLRKDLLHAREDVPKLTGVQIADMRSMMDYQWNIDNCKILVDEAEESFAVFRNAYYNPAFNIDTKVTTEMVTKWLDTYMDQVLTYGYEPNLSILDPRIEDMDGPDYDDEDFSNQSIHDDITELVQSKKDIVEIFNDTSLDMLSKITKLGEMQEDLNGRIEEFVENIVNNPIDTNITEGMSPDLITTQNVSKWLDEIIQDKIQDNPQNNFFNYYLENDFSTSIAESVLDEEPMTSSNAPVEESSMSEANSVLDNEESSVPMSSNEEPSTPISSFDNEEIDI